MHMNEDCQQTDRALFTLFAFNANNSQASEYVNIPRLSINVCAKY